ncbi:MAG TPA: hypothetical protein VMP68_00635 [Candidatus Eisenbacteria bacterium]|nr:hypothetical protein [Candidatus Eisenbacteria bacterium]
MQTRFHKRVEFAALLLTLIAGGFWHPALAADSSPGVTLNVSKANPRQVEPLTESAILRDYKFAWGSLGAALQSNSLAPLNGPFVGEAASHLAAEVKTQQQNDLTLRYANQRHKLEAVFYSPEGDIAELHDTAEYDFEILAGGKSIHSEHAVVHYIVLMTPGADRWVIRHLQAVPQF